MEKMKDRLEKFIRTEGLTPSRFAEIMGVQPSSISHILGGRNKPSFDFIEKMLLRFPKVNPDWLLLGKGPIYRTPDSVSNSSSDSSVIANLPHRQTVVMGTSSDTLPFETLTAGESAQTKAPEQSSKISSSNEVLNTPTNPIQERITDSNSLQNRPASKVLSELPFIDDETIEQIVIFLKDKTFISYRPK